MNLRIISYKINFILIIKLENSSKYHFKINFVFIIKFEDLRKIKFYLKYSILKI